MTGSRTTNLRTGILFAVCTGMIGGSILVPLSFAPTSLQGIAFLPSFGFGVLSVASCIRFFPNQERYTHVSMSSIPVMNAAVGYGVLSGVIWNMGNICSIYAMKSGLSYGVAYPILQCALGMSKLISKWLVNVL